MDYNDIKYTKIVTHMMFVQSLKEHANDENKTKCENILNMLTINQKNLNCFIKQNIKIL